MKGIKTSLTALVLAVGAVAVLGSAGAHAADKLKAAWIYVGPTGDMGWSYQHDLGRLAVEKALGDKVQTTKVESVPETADAERVLTKLAQDGNKLIFATSFGYMNPVIKVAADFPKTHFEHATGFKRADNVSTYAIRFYEGRVVQGFLAGKLSKSGIIGYVAPVPIPEVISGIDAFTIALHKVRPDAKVKVIYVNDWYDPGKEAAAAKALIAQGADVIAQHTDSPAPVQTAEQAGLWSFGQSSDMAKFGPKHEITANVDNWSDYYIQEVKAALDGSLKSHDTWGGLSTGMLSMPAFNESLPADLRAQATELLADVKSGKVKAFAGPIVDSTGKEQVPAGKELTDEQVLGLNWYVKGVEGDLPH